MDYGVDNHSWCGSVLRRGTGACRPTGTWWRRTDKSTEVKHGQLDGVDSQPTDPSVYSVLAQLHSPLIGNIRVELSASFIHASFPTASTQQRISRTDRPRETNALLSDRNTVSLMSRRGTERQQASRECVVLSKLTGRLAHANARGQSTKISTRRCFDGSWAPKRRHLVAISVA